MKGLFGKRSPCSSRFWGGGASLLPNPLPWAGACGGRIVCSYGMRCRARPAIPQLARQCLAVAEARVSTVNSRSEGESSASSAGAAKQGRQINRPLGCGAPAQSCRAAKSSEKEISLWRSRVFKVS